jgi:putative flippase GtrA
MRQSRSRPLRFVLIGGASTALYFALLLLLRSHIPSTTLLAGLCYAISMGFNFVGQGLWTFQSGRLSSRSLARYSCMQGAALVVNAAAMGSLVDGFDLPLLPSQIAVTGAVTLCVYFLSANWVYR